MPPARYRCAACGNLTRFDVVVTRKTRAFHHFSLGGELSVEDEEVLAQTVDDVSCRWCGSGKAVEIVPPADGQTDAQSGARTDAQPQPGRSGA